MDLFFIVHPLVLLEFLTKFMYHSFLSKETNIYIYTHTENARLESKSMILLGLKVLSALLCEEMATNSSTLAWRIPGTGERGGLLSMGSHRVGHD